MPRDLRNQLRFVQGQYCDGGGGTVGSIAGTWVATSSITLGRDGTGLVSGTRSFTWRPQDNLTIEASYTGGSGGFILQNIILYKADGIINRATALDESIREGDNGGAPVGTWFEMDCDLQ